MVEVPQEEQKVVQNIIFNLFKERQLERHTYLESEEIPIFTMLLSLGQQNDIFQKKFFDKPKDFECNLTKIAKRGLRLRTSRKGWRSEQVVKVAHSEFNKEEQKTENTLKKFTRIFKK